MPHVRCSRVDFANAGKKFFLVHGRLTVIKHFFTDEYSPVVYEKAVSDEI